MSNKTFQDFDGLTPVEALVFHLVVTPLVIGVSILKMFRREKKQCPR